MVLNYTQTASPPTPLPYEGMGVLSLSPSGGEVWRGVFSIPAMSIVVKHYQNLLQQ